MVVVVVVVGGGGGGGGSGGVVVVIVTRLIFSHFYSLYSCRPGSKRKNHNCSLLIMATTCLRSRNCKRNTR